MVARGIHTVNPAELEMAKLSEFIQMGPMLTIRALKSRKKKGEA